MIRIPGEARHFALFQNVQIDCAGCPATCTIGKVDLSTGVERMGRESDHCPPSSVEVKNEKSYIFVPLYAFMVSTEITPFTIPHPHLSHYSFAT
jgi:hypothetical protein